MSDAAATVHAPHSPGPAGWLPLAILPCCAALLYNRAQPWAFMWALAFSIYMGLKWLSWWQARSRIPHSGWRSIAYLFGWPGMDAEDFLDAAAPVLPPRGRHWVAALSKTMVGGILFWGAARAIPGNPLMRGWVGMIGLILMLHFGSFHLIALFWQWLGVDARPIMSAPLRSTSLAEFWGQRWNLGFRQLSHDFIFRPLQRRLGVWPTTFLVFLVSGMIHDLVISVPARGGYGLPTAYFVAQGVGVAVERSRAGRQLGLDRGVRGWLFMAICTAGPAFWLFHPPFVLRVVVPFMEAVRAL
jgi:Membrane bound O-acyl transferase family